VKCWSERKGFGIVSGLTGLTCAASPTTRFSNTGLTGVRQRFDRCRPIANDYFSPLRGISTPSLLQWRVVVLSDFAELLSLFLQALSLSGSPSL
jgi:hypothetical protein